MVEAIQTCSPNYCSHPNLCKTSKIKSNQIQRKSNQIEKIIPNKKEKKINMGKNENDMAWMEGARRGCTTNKIFEARRLVAQCGAN